MILCGLSDVTPGAILGSIVADPRKPDHDLLRPGVVLDAGLLAGLRLRGVAQLWIEDDLTRDLDTAVAPTLAASRLEVYSRLRNGLTACARSTISTVSIQGYRTAVMGMVIEAVASAPYASMTDALFTADGQASHGANVAYLSLLCGLHIERYVVAEQTRLGPKEAREMTVLGLAGMLHDIGKTRLPSKTAAFHDVHAKESGGAQKRPERYPEHVTLGKALLEDSRAPARIAYVVLHHHQRFDGKGWPDMTSVVAGHMRGTLAGRRIHIFARIVAAANVLDNLLRVAEGAMRPPVAALHEFASARFDGWFDPIVRRALLLRIPPFAIGTDVRLSDGRRGVVISPTPEDPCRPVVRIIPARTQPRDAEPETIDLHSTPGTTITHALGAEVAGFMYQAPPSVPPPPAEGAMPNSVE